MKARPPIAAAIGAAALSLSLWGIAPAAHAEETGSESPCATQEAQVAKAEDALARVTAVFAKQKDHVAEAQAQLDAAETPEEQAKAQKKLDRALARRPTQKRAEELAHWHFAKASSGLADCEPQQEEAAQS